MMRPPVSLAMLAALLLLAGGAMAEVVVPVRAIRSQTVLSLDDLTVAEDTVPGALDDIAAAFADAPDAVARTIEIADRCTFSLDELRYEYPEELTPTGLTPIAYLTALTWAGAAERYPGGVPEKVIFDNGKVAVKDGFGANARKQADPVLVEYQQQNGSGQ